MAFGADHVEAAGLERLGLSLGNLCSDLRALLGDRCAFWLRALFLLLGKPVFQQHVGIAAELNVGAAPGHVGGYGDGAGHARLRDDMRFLTLRALLRTMA